MLNLKPIITVDKEGAYIRGSEKSQGDRRSFKRHF